ncbi:MAG TPA: hypothetical protein VK993_09620 [Chthoniobacterales bacterium]|nr:hypothetical protein [Chthoniobacterales bacterium]
MAQKKTEKEANGASAVSMPERLRIEAIACEQLLAPFGKRLSEAVEFYVAHLRAVSTSKTVAQTVDEMIREKRADGLSQRYVADLRVRLARFTQTFGQQIIATVDAPLIDEWLRSLAVSGVTRNTFRRRLAALFSFAKSKRYLTTSPLRDVARAKEVQSEVGILTVDELTTLLQSASSETLPFWAIGAFAGLRRAELERLDWVDVDLEDRHITVRAENAKTAARRIVNIEPNLLAWLSSYGGLGGPVCPPNLQLKINDDRARAGLLRGWPQNALRHSFGSYHLAMYQDAAALALQMGNSPAVIFRHYRELVKRRDAIRYWQIEPDTIAAPEVIVAADRHSSAGVPDRVPAAA